MIYANDIDPYCCDWLLNLDADGVLPPAIIDNRSILDVRPDDLRPFTHVHLFAGIGGWAIACQLAGWPEWRQICTISCPCQPFSKAGKGGGFDDERDLWPHTLPLIRDLRPEVAVGEQVDGTAGNAWIDRTRTDLEGIGYAFGAVILPALCVNGPTRRYRWFWIASRTPGGRKALERIAGAGRRPAGQPTEAVSEPGSIERPTGRSGTGGSGMARCESESPGVPGQPWRGPDRDGLRADGLGNREWDQFRWVIGPDRDKRTGWLKARRIPCSSTFNPDDGSGLGSVPWGDQRESEGARGKADKYSRRITEPDLRGVATGIPAGAPELRTILLAKGVPQRAEKIRGYGNAIVPQVGAAVIRSYMEAEAEMEMERTERPIPNA